MAITSPKAVSVTEDGREDGWQPEAGWCAEITPHGDTRLTVSVPVAQLPFAHRALVACMAPPLHVLYRQNVNRRDPKPQGSPPRDFVARDQVAERVVAALEAAAPLLYGDARCELWLQGALGERLVLDEDGVVYIYPDDPAFRDALGGLGLEEAEIELVSGRDYVKHWFHAEADPLEDALLADLGLVEVPHRPG